MSRIRRTEALTGWALLGPFAVLFLFVFLVPIAVSIWTSLFKQQSSGGGLYGGGEIGDVFVGMDNYLWLIGDARFWQGMGRVVLYAAFQIPIMLILALALAVVLDSWLVRRIGGYRLSYFLPYAIPGVVAAMIWLYLYTPEISPIVAGLDAIGIHVDFLAEAVVLPSMANMTTWTYTGLNMLIFLAALQAIPRDLEEAARLDGASAWQVVTRIKVPMVSGAVLMTVLLSIIGTIQLFNEPAVMAKAAPWMDGDYTPMMMAYNTMMGGISPSGDGPASAVSIMMALIAGILALGYVFVQKRIAR